MRHRLYIHLVWTTRGRQRLLDRDLARFLCRFLRAMARKERAYILEIGMVQTHIHLLARVHPAVAVSRLVKRLKGASSAVAGHEGLGSQGRLYWAKGYAVHSVSTGMMESVRNYLRGQPGHHPDELIDGWEGDVPEYYQASGSRSVSRRVSVVKPRIAEQRLQSRAIFGHRAALRGVTRD